MTEIRLLESHGGGLSNALRNLHEKTGIGQAIKNTNNGVTEIYVATYSPTLWKDSEENFRREVDYYKELIYSLSDTGHLIFISSQTLELTNKTQYSKAKSEIEKILLASGKNFTIIRPGMIYDLENRKFTLRSMHKASKSIFTFHNDTPKTTACTVEDIYQTIVTIANKIDVYSGMIINLGIRRHTFNGLQNIECSRVYRLPVLPFVLLKMIALVSTRLKAYVSGSASSEVPDAALKSYFDY